MACTLLHFVRWAGNQPYGDQELTEENIAKWRKQIVEMYVDRINS